MSGFQYYEFQVVGRSLTKEEINQVCSLSSRARVNKNRAIFMYNFGSFRGNTEELLAKYFDAFLYISSFGTKELSFRIPCSLFNPKALCLYEYEYVVETETHGSSIIIKLLFDNEEGGGWIEEEDCVGLLDDMAPIRDHLIKGDPRALYLSLLAQRSRISTDDARERREGYLQSLPVPPNLKNLDPALEALITFFEVPLDIVTAAAQGSPVVPDFSLDLTKTQTLLADIPIEEKDAFLLRLLEGDTSAVTDLHNKLQGLLMRSGEADAGVWCQRKSEWVKP